MPIPTPATRSTSGEPGRSTEAPVARLRSGRLSSPASIRAVSRPPTARSASPTRLIYLRGSAHQVPAMPPTSTTSPTTALTSFIMRPPVTTTPRAGAVSTARGSSPIWSTALPAALLPFRPPPRNVAATAGNAKVSLSWTVVSGATKATRSIARRSAVAGYAVIGTATTGSYVNTGLTNGTTYYYVVTAVNSAGESPQSAQGFGNARPLPSPRRPRLPTWRRQRAMRRSASPGRPPPAAGELQRLPFDGQRQPRATRSSARLGRAVTYVDKAVTNGTTYYYVVTAASECCGGEPQIIAGLGDAGPALAPARRKLQLLGNPGFENGANGAPWVATAGVFNNSRCGACPQRFLGRLARWLQRRTYRYARSDGNDPHDHYDGDAHLLAAHRHRTPTSSRTTDTLQVQIRNSSGAVLTTLATYTNQNKASGYSQKTFDLSAYKGQTDPVSLPGRRPDTASARNLVRRGRLRPHRAVKRKRRVA